MIYFCNNLLVSLAIFKFVKFSEKCLKMLSCDPKFSSISHYLWDKCQMFFYKFPRNFLFVDIFGMFKNVVLRSSIIHVIPNSVHFSKCFWDKCKFMFFEIYFNLAFLKNIQKCCCMIIDNACQIFVCFALSLVSEFKILNLILKQPVSW